MPLPLLEDASGKEYPVTVSDEIRKREVMQTMMTLSQSTSTLEEYTERGKLQ
jgi:hypothetical protein